MPENLTHGYKKNIKKQQKTFLLFRKLNQEVKKELLRLINSVLEDILIYHLRLKEISFFLKKKVSKNYKC